MDIDGLTWDRDDLDRWLRIETSVDLLRGELPRTRLVCFDRGRPILTAHGRGVEPGEDWIEHVGELLFLARSLRPAAVAVGFTMRPAALDSPDPHLTLVVTTGVRRLSAHPLTEVRAHPYVPGEEGLLEWLPAPDDPDLAEAAALPRRALRRPSWRARCFPHVIADHLRSRGHRLDATPSVAARLHLEPTGVPGGM